MLYRCVVKQRRYGVEYGTASDWPPHLQVTALIPNLVHYKALSICLVVYPSKPRELGAFNFVVL